jgi:5-methylcytosine-specific restriction endonuclease McrA
MWFKGDDKAWMDDALNDLSDAEFRLYEVMNRRVAHDASEGRVTVAMLRSIKRIIGQREADNEAALVDAGLWHDAKTIRRCSDCREIPPKLEDGKLKPGECYVHGWLVDQFTRDESLLPEVRRKAIRRKQISRSTELREQIYERDQGMCRYCGVRVNWADKRSTRRPQHDHVDPDGGNELGNVVTACATCNQEKGHRTPAEWVAAGGRALLEPGTGPAKSEPVRTQAPFGSDLATRAQARDIGPGQVGHQVGSDQEQIPVNGNGSHR